MTKKHTNCPTCGSLAYYPSENFEIAGIMIAAENQIKSELEKLSEANARLQMIAEGKLGIKDLSSNELMDLYFKKIREEGIEEKKKADAFYEPVQNKIEEDIQKAVEKIRRNSWSDFPYGKREY